MKNPECTRLVSLTAAMGMSGGAVLLISAATFGSGKFIMVPYAILMMLAVAITRAERIGSFGVRFAVLTTAFMLSSAFLYVAIALSPSVADLSIVGHVLRLGILFLIGATIGLPGARLAGSSQASPAP